MQKRMRKTLDEYKAVIFDMDGTLYDQRPVRVRMAVKLALFCLRAPAGKREVRLLYHYRRLREHGSQSDMPQRDMERLQYEKAAQKADMTWEEAERIVGYWMRQVPLSILGNYRDETMAVLFQWLKDRGITRVIYSDYPAAEKLAALSLTAEACFSSEDPAIGTMKPDPRGLEYILKKTDLAKEDVLMIGDRFCKDAEAAIAAGIDYIVVSSLPCIRNLQMNGIRKKNGRNI